MASTGLRIYFVVRKDLKMSTGKIVAQCGHALEKLLKGTPKAVLSEYSLNGSPKIALQVPNLEKLLEIKADCASARVQKHLVTDAGLTQIPAGSMTVLGIGPVRAKYLPESVSALKLL